MEASKKPRGGEEEEKNGGYAYGGFKVEDAVREVQRRSGMSTAHPHPHHPHPHHLAGVAPGGGGQAPPYDGIARTDPRGENLIGPSGPFGLQIADQPDKNGKYNPYREATDRQKVDVVKRALDYFASERGLAAHRVYDVNEYLLWRNRVNVVESQEEIDQEVQNRRREDAMNTAAVIPQAPAPLGAPAEVKKEETIARAPYDSRVAIGNSVQETNPWDFICTWAPLMAGPMRSAWNHWMYNRVYVDENAFLREDNWHLWVSLACVKHSQTCATAGSGGNVMSKSALTLSHLKNSRDIDRVLGRLGEARTVSSDQFFY